MFNRGTLTDKSGTCTAGATAQTIAVANKNRRYLYVQNISDTIMYINTGATATADHIPLQVSGGAGSSFTFDKFIPTGLISLLCATTGKKFICKEG